MTLKHLRSSTANKRPTPAAMAEAQLALNIEATSPGLFFKNASGALVKVGPVHVGTTAPNATPASGGESGNSTGELWLDTSVTPNELKTWNGSAWVSATPDELPVSKLADGSARQLLQTDAAGTGVEWTSNVDIPGTLDVTGAATFDSSVTVQGDLTVNGTTTTIDTTTLVVEDKNIEMGVVGTPTDTTADGGGITLKGTTDKTINWVNATDSWTSSEHVDLASAKEYRIAGTKVLDATSLGSAVVSSSLTSVGTISTGVWEGTAINKTYLDSTLVSTGDTGTVTSTMIANGTIVDEDINASAAIAGTKISPDFGSQTITTTGVVSAALGAEATPSITFTGDLNTGIYSPGADQVAISTNGSQRVTVDSTGKVGIGTGSPASPLHVLTGVNGSVSFLQRTDTAWSANDYAEILLGATAGARGVIRATTVDAAATSGATKLSFYTQTNTNVLTERVTIDQSGRVGIGTTSPANPLHIANQYPFIRFQSNSGSYQGRNMIGQFDNVFSIEVDNDNAVANSALAIYVDGSEQMRIPSTGGVEVSQGGLSHCFFGYASSGSYTGTIYSSNCARSASNAYNFLIGYSGNFSDLEFRLRGDGIGYSDGGWTTPASDYAEYFEWQDGNSDNEDRRGISVVLDGTKIREAVAGEEPLGIISARPSIVGDAATECWKEKYLTDDFGSYIMEPHSVISWTDEDGNKHEYQDFNMPEDAVVPDDAVIAEADENGVPFTHRKLNPDYDPNQTYISREHRPEWDTVGLLGKLRMRKGQVTGSLWIKMRDISDTVEEWLVR